MRNFNSHESFCRKCCNDFSIVFMKLYFKCKIFNNYLSTNKIAVQYSEKIGNILTNKEFFLLSLLLILFPLLLFLFLILFFFFVFVSFLFFSSSSSLLFFSFFFFCLFLFFFILHFWLLGFHCSYKWKQKHNFDNFSHTKSL